MRLPPPPPAYYGYTAAMGSSFVTRGNRRRWAEGGKEGGKEAPLDARDLWKRNVRKRERRKGVQYSASGSCDIGGHKVP